MTILIAGIILWIGIHLIPSVGVQYKQALVDKMGLLAYRTAFALTILTALGLIIIGWQSTQAVFVYLPIAGLRIFAIGLVMLAVVLLGATGRATRIGRLVRYPQLAAILVWAGAHLLANGDNRSLILFGSAAFWAVLMMVVITRREGTWQKKPAPSWSVELLGIALSLAAIAGIVTIHPWLTGMPIF
jgi:uncharacterized membrane protein